LSLTHQAEQGFGVSKIAGTLLRGLAFNHKAPVPLSPHLAQSGARGALTAEDMAAEGLPAGWRNPT
jgi:hypothetical protein